LSATSLSNTEAAGYFLPYQWRWIQDATRYKIAEKSRRVGITYAQSYEDVRDAARQINPMDVWFSSADESAAREYILYCQKWAKLFNIVAEYLGEIVIDEKKGIKALSIEFSNGKRINALSSNPTGFRSKGGKLVLDEYAFHADQERMWKAAKPIITWGYPVRVLSTYNGKGNRYARMVGDAKKAPKQPWSLHTIDIVQAVDQGLADRIVGKKLTQAEREAWLEEERAGCGDEETWQQEYMCQPVDESTAWLTWDLIASAEHADAGKPEFYLGGDCYIGVDVGRRRDLTVFWVLERVGDVLWTREVVRMKNATFAAQDAEEDRLMATYNVRRMCKDQGGMGEKPVEDSKARHGSYRVEGVLFTAPVKQELAQTGKQKYEDKMLRTPPDRAIRESHHSVRKITTSAGNVRFDADRTEVGHADEFWAHMLAIHAAEDVVQPPAGATVAANDESLPSARFAGRLRGGMFGRRTGS
jgi:phage FluMu gp28-like protein